MFAHATTLFHPSLLPPPPSHTLVYVFQIKAYDAIGFERHFFLIAFDIVGMGLIHLHKQAIEKPMTADGS